MSHRAAIHIILFGAFLFSVASLPARHAPGSSPQRTKVGKVSSSAKEKIDVCILLTSAEIEAVQGEPVKETGRSVQPSGGMLMSQCLFRTPTFAKSVSLALATPDPTKRSALTPRKYWRKQFHPLEQENGEKAKEEKAASGKAPRKPEPEREKELSKPRVIDGLGEEAYWMGNPIIGALYVLKGDAFLRISIGGGENESVRIKKADALAQKVLSRCPLFPQATNKSNVPTLSLLLRREPFRDVGRLAIRAT